MDNETNIINFVNSEKIKKENQPESSEKSIKILEEDLQDNGKDVNKVINIHQIADRIHEHSDVWACKTCPRTGDKWDILTHYSSCKRNKK